MIELHALQGEASRLDAEMATLMSLVAVGTVPGLVNDAVGESGRFHAFIRGTEHNPVEHDLCGLRCSAAGG